MAEFLNSTAINYRLEELINDARERLIIISPFLKFNARIRELLEDKDRMKIDVRIVYGKSELAPAEINWLRSLNYVRTSFCQNLHAKCYLNEKHAIVTSMNLYDFSQVNNNEMGVFFSRDGDSELYAKCYEEVQRLIRISEEIRLSAEKVPVDTPEEDTPNSEVAEDAYEKLTTSKLAKQINMRSGDLTDRLVAMQLLAKDGEGKLVLTEAGKAAGGEFRLSKKFGPYFLWPKDLAVR